MQSAQLADKELNPDRKLVFHNIVCSAKGKRKRLDGAQIAHNDLGSQAKVQAQQPVCKELIRERYSSQ